MKLDLPDDLLQPFPGTLVGFSGERVKIRGYLDLRTTFGEGRNAKTIRVVSSYNVIISHPSLNALGAFVSSPHLCMKYLLRESEVGVVWENQVLARQCYQESLKPWRRPVDQLKSFCHNVQLLDLDP